MTAGLTGGLAGAIVGLRSEAMPASALATIRRAIADCAGVMIAGSGEPVVAKVRAALGGRAFNEKRLPDFKGR